VEADRNGCECERREEELPQHGFWTLALRGTEFALANSVRAEPL
jgi:hypothetical protein